MRLTLRTLLNWTNNNLSEEDAKLVARKVEESELAKLLKNQIDELMVCQQLPAPSPLDGTPKGNANSAAEYIEGAMDPQQTAEYEKFCIHSEVTLGEIASCHQILSQVLTLNLGISPELRQRLCNLHKFIDANDENSIPIHLKSQETEIFDELPLKEKGVEFTPSQSDRAASVSADSKLPGKKVTQPKVSQEMVPVGETRTDSALGWKIAFSALLSLNIIYIVGRLFGFLP